MLSFGFLNTRIWCFNAGIYSSASEASREVAILTERKNQHTPVNGEKEFVCLSVCLSVINFDTNYLRTKIPNLT